MKSIYALELADAKHMVAEAEKLAIANSWNVTIAVCDAGGHMLLVQRMDGAPLMSATVAQDKARSSVLSSKPTKQLEDMVNGGRVAALAMPVSPLEGGELLLANNRIVGAIGVSGVKASEDALIAQSGVAALKTPD